MSRRAAHGQGGINRGILVTWIVIGAITQPRRTACFTWPVRGGLFVCARESPLPVRDVVNDGVMCDWLREMA